MFCNIIIICFVSHLKSFVRELLVSPLFKFDVYSGVKGARVHCLGSW